MELPIVSALEFDQVRSSIKNYIKTKTDFTDYDFEGSNLSMLVDILSYNTLYTSYNVNMAANELNLDTAVLRDNIVSIAKRLGYTPNSYSSASVELDITVNNVSQYNTVRLDRGSVLAASANNKNYSFILRDKLEITVNGRNSVKFSNVKIYEGIDLGISYIVDETNENQRFFISNNSVDIDSIRVSVISDPTNNVEVEYTKKNTIVDVKNSDEVFFVEEVQDQKYEIIFGDDVIGRKVRDGEIIKIQYMITSGGEANDISKFRFTGNVRGLNGVVDAVLPYGDIDYVLTSGGVSDGGSSFESSKSIKYRAPRYYASQERAVTISDYEAIIQQIYANSELVRVTGGENLNPKRYGEVYISIKPKVGDYVSLSEKDRILKEVEKYKVGSVSVNIVDPGKLTIVGTPTLVYDSTQTRNREPELRSLINDAIGDYISSDDFNKFGGKYSDLKLRCSIKELDNSIQYVKIPYYLKQEESIAPGVITKYDTDFFTKLNPGTEDTYYMLSDPFCHKGIKTPVFLGALADNNNTNPNCDTDTNIYLFDMSGRIIDVVGSINPETGELDYTIQPCDDDDPVDPINIFVIPEFDDFITDPGFIPELDIDDIIIDDINDDPEDPTLSDDDGPFLPFDEIITDPPLGDDSTIGTGTDPEFVPGPPPGGPGEPIIIDTPGGGIVVPPIIVDPSGDDEVIEEPIISDPNDYTDLENYTPETNPYSC